MIINLHKNCILPTGTITEVDPVTKATEKVVYQRTSYLAPNLPPINGRPMQRRRHVIPHNPRTPAQTVRRGKFADAVTAWQVLPIADKVMYGRRASKQARTGYNLFISEYLSQE